MTQQKKNIVVTVSGPADQLASFVQLCKTIQQLCQFGASRTIILPVDGDGSGNLRFDFGTLDHSGVSTPAITGEDRIWVGGIGG